MNLKRKSYMWPITLVWGFFVAVLACGLIYDRITIAKLQSEIDRLAPEVGRMKVEDRSKLKIALVKSDFPETMTWRIYSAGNENLSVYCEVPNYESEATIWPRDGNDNILKWQLERHPKSGRILLLHGTEQAGGDSVYLYDEVDQFLRKHHQELDVEILGSEEPVVAQADGVVTLVKASVPETLLELARQELSPAVYRHLGERPLILCRMGIYQVLEQVTADEEKQRGQQ